MISSLGKAILIFFREYDTHLPQEDSLEGVYDWINYIPSAYSLKISKTSHKSEFIWAIMFIFAL